MYSSNRKKLKYGFTLVEVIIATSIILVFLTALVGAYNLYLRLALANSDIAKAAYLAEEGIEAFKFLRDSSWSAYIAPLSSGTDYYLAFANNTWVVTTSNVYIDAIFERKINLSSVYRNSSGDIVVSGGSLDPNAKKIDVAVSWKNRESTTTKAISTYITNLVAN